MTAWLETFLLWGARGAYPLSTSARFYGVLIYDRTFIGFIIRDKGKP